MYTIISITHAPFYLWQKKQVKFKKAKVKTQYDAFNKDLKQFGSSVTH